MEDSENQRERDGVAFKSGNYAMARNEKCGRLGKEDQVETRPIAVRRVLRAISDGPTDKAAYRVRAKAE